MGIQNDYFSIRELLQIARAADNLLYAETCSPARDAGAVYEAWDPLDSRWTGDGDSCQFGEGLPTTEHDEGIDYSYMERIRPNLPLWKQLRGDLYQLVDVQREKSKRESITMKCSPLNNHKIHELWPASRHWNSREDKHFEKETWWKRKALNNT